MAVQRSELPKSETEPLAIVEVMLRYVRFAQHYYVRADGSQTEELSCIRLALRPVKRLCGHTPACTFGPLALKTVRDEMIKMAWSRGNINNSIGRVKRMFKWATAEELIPPSVHQGLSTVVGLKSGRSAAKETEPVKPVPDDILNATLTRLSPTVRAMVDLQLVIGAVVSALLAGTSHPARAEGPPPPHRRYALLLNESRRFVPTPVTVRFEIYVEEAGNGTAHRIAGNVRGATSDEALAMVILYVERHVEVNGWTIRRYTDGDPAMWKRRYTTEIDSGRIVEDVLWDFLKRTLEKRGQK